MRVVSSKILLFLPKLLTRCWRNFQQPYITPGGWFSKLAAGWLIDQCQLKGTQIGGAAVHRQQALVLINEHDAKAKMLYSWRIM